MSFTTPVDGRFFAPRTPVSVVNYGATDEALLIRAMLEHLGCVVTLHWPGTPEDFLLVLEQQVAPPYMVLCGHGDEKGLLFETYIPEIDVSALEGIHLPPRSIAARVRLPGCVILSTACMSGTGEMAAAMLAGGARAYIAPEDYPAGADVGLFVLSFFHALLERGMSVEQAWKRAVRTDPEFGMFGFFTPQGRVLPEAQRAQGRPLDP
ncbi:hypothetical protein HNR42_003489 [Deinobacterium chartae]|uniref:CHAT domain-containing protein n=1 Tax=Deinobacterium chartae TaxID=521158 RepID=A0A841I4R8_9DEIO|nr:hypothetical protein [Deinobacterium chartae]MBB6100024.1 hypothetical protein [Deinobacterium chartae]